MTFILVMFFYTCVFRWSHDWWTTKPQATTDTNLMKSSWLENVWWRCVFIFLSPIFNSVPPTYGESRDRNSQNKVTTFIYHLIHIFNYSAAYDFGESISSTKTIRANNVCYYRRFEELKKKSDFNLSAFRPTYLLTLCSRTKGASVDIKLRLYWKLWHESLWHHVIFKYR